MSAERVALAVIYFLCGLGMAIASDTLTKNTNCGALPVRIIGAAVILVTWPSPFIGTVTIGPRFLTEGCTP